MLSAFLQYISNGEVRRCEILTTGWKTKAKSTNQSHDDITRSHKNFPLKDRSHSDSGLAGLGKQIPKMSIRFASIARTGLTRLATKGPSAPKTLKTPLFSGLSSTIRPFSGKPTIEMAKEAPKEYYEMSNETIIKLSAEGIFEAM